MLASIAVGPFAQQLITTRFLPVQTAQDHEGLFIPRTNRFDALVTARPDNSLGSAGYVWIDAGTGPATGLEAKAAIWTGLVSGTIEDAKFSCPAENCTWPLQPSLAVCGECAPITPVFKYTSGNDSGAPITITLKGSSPWIYEFNSSYSLTTPIAMDTSVQKQTVKETSSTYANMTRPYVLSHTWQPGRTKVWTVVAENYILLPDRKSLNVSVSDADAYYSIDGTTLNAYQNVLSDQFTGTYNTTSNSSRPAIASSGLATDFIELYGPGLVVANVAASLSKYIRTYVPTTALNMTLVSKGNFTGPSVPLAIDSTPDPRYLGTASTLEPYFIVHWSWLVLPIALVLVAPAFFMPTIWLSRRRRIPVLGNSLLALMNCQIDETVRDQVGLVDNIDDLSRATRKIHVELVGEADGLTWKLRRAEKEEQDSGHEQ